MKIVQSTTSSWSVLAHPGKEIQTKTIVSDDFLYHRNLQTDQGRLNSQNNERKNRKKESCKFNIINLIHYCFAQKDTIKEFRTPKSKNPKTKPSHIIQLFKKKKPKNKTKKKKRTKTPEKQIQYHPCPFPFSLEEGFGECWAKHLHLQW
ncbi:hypothetical protein QQP08_017883 [Theobroma cacao]|nr:hypothetical protein QQP08_017883 [Theobroma cacao]